MTTNTKSALIALAITASSLAATAAFAQTTSNIMPALYNASNVEVNSTGSNFAIGYYHLANNDQVYYYGNGTYYDQTAQIYGGSVNNPNGMAGVTLNYTTSVTAGGSTMPPLYNSSNTQVNSTSAYLPAGYYFLAGGQQVYYYGNGTYYNATAGVYGGSVNNPNGLAGVSLGYVASASTVPGLPNTGAGGNALLNWMLLVASALVASAGLSYLIRSRSSTRHA